MSQDILREIMFLLHSLALGIVITFVYDWFIILRRLIKHTDFLVSVEDMLFWIACAIGIFYMLYEENNGVLRWFAVAGATLGMVVYKKTVSPFLIKTAVKFFSWICSLLSRLFGFLFKPVYFLLKKAGKGCRSMQHKGGKIRKRMKKKLTEYKKVLKIILCKQQKGANDGRKSSLSKEKAK